MPLSGAQSLLGMQLPVYEGPQQQPQAPTTPCAAASGGALPPPSPKDVESELLRTHMQVLSTYVDRCSLATHSHLLHATVPCALLLLPLEVIVSWLGTAPP